MSSKVSFNNQQNDFFSNLKEKVNQHFAENGISPTGNSKLYTKSLIQIFSAILLYVVLVFFTPGVIPSIILCILLGLNLAIIGFNIMHEAAHQCYSSLKVINTIGTYSLNMLGGSSFFWKIKHNINHHTYTNIEGVDSDIDLAPFMRLHENQKKRWFHRFQHIYCLFLYSLSYLSWIFKDDFVRYFTGNIAPGQKRKLEIKEHIIFWTTKIGYLAIYVIIPILTVGLQDALIGFAIMCLSFGLCISIVFQLAHVVEDTSFPLPDAQTNKIQQEWAVHQIITTANFSTKNRMISWFLGGLNFQVEHHLFPRISHVHYPVINKFVRETCDEFKISYLEYPSMFRAIHSHFSHIRKLGKLT